MYGKKYQLNSCISSSLLQISMTITFNIVISKVTRGILNSEHEKITYSSEYFEIYLLE